VGEFPVEPVWAEAAWTSSQSPTFLSVASSQEARAPSPSCKNSEDLRQPPATESNPGQQGKGHVARSQDNRAQAHPPARREHSSAVENSVAEEVTHRVG
jgi:hypothetical protein